MSREREAERDSDPLSVDWISKALREPVPVRPEWRAELLRGIEQLAAPSPPRGWSGARWRVRPLTAVAACVVCALAGAGVTTLVLARGQHAALAEASGSLTAAATSRSGEVAGRSTVRFVFVAPYASNVALVGDFNGWNPSKMPMRRSADGHAWLIDVPLAPGRHVYSFVVDGDLAADPAAPRAGDDDFGVPSSVVLVAGAKT